MASPSLYTGRCLCGTLRYQVAGPATSVGYCHCISCRRASGAPYVAWATFPRDTFVLTQGALAEHRSSTHVMRGFCPACGTPLSYRHDRRPGEIDLTLATLDDPSVLTPGFHIWIEHKLPWVRLDDGLAQFQRFRPDG